ncbi:pyridoxamine 5'-phosphate oxidase family protein [Desulfurispira natronophila]|uniref:Pyridoxamine 5'-phosphate oxidase family protein n=1 Tax=Desulfurispira natronophila TaxID=682562 RepID=A0A7W8DH94_9BACT|nr:pyridoxamine 5'-phosphate oxidase family protein [Desulfurispira natronophila]MBB5022053.1 hypothetical protein [Desulfurispira natronophila]
MTLKEYFTTTEGTAVLSTADREGNVNSAIYARPHVMDDGRLAFLMRERLSYANISSNPRAAYLFKENGPGYQGKRLILNKVDESDDQELVESLRRTSHGSKKGDDITRVVYFQVTKELPLVGSGE